MDPEGSVLDLLLEPLPGAVYLCELKMSAESTIGRDLFRLVRTLPPEILLPLTGKGNFRVG